MQRHAPGGRGAWRTFGIVALVAVALAGCEISSSSTGATPSAAATSSPISSWDWPSYGHDAQHTFHGRTTLTESSVQALRQAWFFPTGDAVTATPTVVGGTVYVGSWDDFFYAVNLRTGKLRWKVRLASQNAITPYPGQQPRDATSDGGLVTSSAWFEPGAGSRPALVIFGGGYTLYAAERRHRRGLLGARLPRRARTSQPERRQHADLLVTGGRRRPRALRRGRGWAAALGRLRGGGQPRHRRPGVGVPDRRRQERPGARRQLWQRLVVRHRVARPRAGRVRHG